MLILTIWKPRQGPFLGLGGVRPPFYTIPPLKRNLARL